MNKFKTPSKTSKRLKFMLFGLPGVGKTTAAIQFPRPALIDTERGSENDQYVDIIRNAGGGVLSTTSFDEVVQQVRSLASEKHDYKTLIIDPITVLYDGLADMWEKRVGNSFSAHRAAAKRDFNRLNALLQTLDMNVVFTSHAKNEWLNGDMTGRMVYDGPKGVDYWMDLLIEVQRRGEERTAKVFKSRISSLPVDDEFKFSYDEIAHRYGRETLERGVVPIEFATEEQVNELESLIAKHSEGPALVGKLLKRAKCETFVDFTNDQIGKAIQWLKTA